MRTISAPSPGCGRSCKCPVYCTPFAAQILAPKLKEAGLDEEVPVKVMPLGSTFKVGPFDLEFVSVTHSIPEPTALLIKTTPGHACCIPATGRSTARPVLGQGMDEKRGCARSATRASTCWSAIPPMCCARASRPPKRDVAATHRATS